MPPLLSSLDTNGDGELSAEEIDNAAKSLKKLDKNGDGKLSRDEIRPAFPGGQGGPPPGDFRGPGGGGPEQGDFRGPPPGDFRGPPQRDSRGRGGAREGGQGGPGQGDFRGPPPGDAQGAGARRDGSRTGSTKETTFEAAPRGKDETETKLLALIDTIRREQGNQMNVPATDGRMLRLLTEAIEAKTVVEIGTSNGISGIYFGTALRKTGGKLITHEIDPDTAARARKNFEAAGISDLVTIVEGDAHQKVAELKGPIDVVFIDADKQGYVDYLKKLLPLVRPGGLILAHNMVTRMADPAFVRAITTDPELETLFYTPGGGLSVSLKKR